MNIEKIAAMRRLILDIDTHQIPDEFIQTRGKEISTDTDVDTLINDWNAAKLAARNPDEAKADSDIEKWSKGK